VEYRVSIWPYSGVPLGSTRDASSGNCLCDNGSPNPLMCTGPNLTAAAPIQNTATIGVAQAFTATITNNGTASTGASFNNFFRVATQANGGGTISTISVTSRALLTAGADGTVTSSVHTFTSAGTYSVQVCTDNDASMAGTITESNE